MCRESPVVKAAARDARLFTRNTSHLQATPTFHICAERRLLDHVLYERPPFDGFNTVSVKEDSQRQDLLGREALFSGEQRKHQSMQATKTKYFTTQHCLELTNIALRELHSYNF